MTGRLIIVSNRLPSFRKVGAGGLAVALKQALAESGGLWFGWSGNTSQRRSPRAKRFERKGIDYAALDLTEKDYETYYAGFSNRVLWPIFHHRVDLAAFDHSFVRGYRSVNKYFARHLARILEPGDVLWVHDYHLIPLAHELRALGVKNRIGFFLHIPWPVPEMLAAIPNHRDLLESLFAYDLVGFQTRRHLRTFEACINAEPGGRTEPGEAVNCFGKRLVTGVFPIGIDADAFAGLAISKYARSQFRRINRSMHGRKLMIGIDRLDYSKGLPERIYAVEHLLEAHPEVRGKVSYLQIAPPSRSDVPEYLEIRHELETSCGHINGRFADIDWVPIRYVNRAYGQQTLAGLLRAARVGLVTPLRDGMNLVAKEFVASQNPDDPGVLVLSQFAGAADQLDAALIVNPYDAEQTGEAIYQAIEMPKAERRRRWESMMAILRAEDINWWRDRFLTALEATKRPMSQADPGHRSRVSVAVAKT